MDLVVVLDASGSIRAANPSDGSRDNWNEMLEFTTDLVDRLSIGQYNSRVGVVRYSDSAQNIFYLNSYYNKETIKSEIRSISYPGGQTYTGDGLRSAHMEQFTYDRGDRPEVHNVIILITDGVSNIDVPSTTREALVAKNKGITVYSIGVTNGVDEEELKAVSTNPQQLGANYFMAADFDTLRDVADTLIKSACRPSYGK